MTMLSSLDEARQRPQEWKDAQVNGVAACHKPDCASHRIEGEHND